MNQTMNKRIGQAMLALTLAVPSLLGCSYAGMQATSTETGAHLAVGNGFGSDMYHCVVQPGARPVCTPVVEQ
ncbi:MAG: hypothetical protein AAF366_06255 [Pseudomonadota bacterium]